MSIAHFMRALPELRHGSVKYLVSLKPGGNLQGSIRNFVARDSRMFLLSIATLTEDSRGALAMLTIVGRTLKGQTKSILVEEEAVTISYRALYHGFKGDKRIPYKSMTAVQFME